MTESSFPSQKRLRFDSFEHDSESSFDGTSTSTHGASNYGEMVKSTSEFESASPDSVLYKNICESRILIINILKDSWGFPVCRTEVGCNQKVSLYI